ncbi:serine/threonine-protein kinase 10-like isoform X2 [Tubulanus polymorphus]|uniref:serine/threonine-protein kinase 10-like isoform X2 n=1 Tax=Tubulanus polymorphus TaxID=672921 RepID=UPI003DA224E9
MSFFAKFKNIFKVGFDSSEKKKKINENICRDKNPEEFWEITGELGDGAFGKVYRARNKETGVEAALKQVEIKDEEDLEDFTVEIDIITAVKHENVIGLHEAFLWDDKLWMYIEFCGAGALDSIMLDLEKPLTEPQIKAICRSMCEGLHALHNANIIHRDLKAGNVLLTADGNVKLADFGVSAKNSSNDQKRDTFIGTPYWMAPEVILCETFKDNPYNYKADIWSLGITLIEFAETNPPYNDMHPMRVLIKIQKADPPRLQKQQKWSPQFRDFVKICLNKNPELRPDTIDLLNHDFIKDVTDNRAIRELISEAKAEVIETMEDVPDDKPIGKRDSRTSLDAESNDGSDSSVTGSIDITKVTSTLPPTENHDDKQQQSTPTATVVITNSDEDRHEECVTAGDNEQQIDTHVCKDDDDDDDDAEDEGVSIENELHSVIAAEEKKNDDVVVCEAVVDDIVDDVIKSDEDEPSVPGVVSDSIDEILQEDPIPVTNIDEAIRQGGVTVNQLTEGAEPDDETTNIDDLNAEDEKTNVDDIIVETPGGESVKQWTDSESMETISSTEQSHQQQQTDAGVTDAGVTVTGVTEPGKTEQVVKRRTENRMVKNKTAEKGNFRTLTKVRKYVVDGVVVTSTTSKVIIEGEENRNKEDFEMRKQDLRELKLLQKLENKQYQDLVLKAQNIKQTEDKRYELEMQSLLKSYEADIENLNRQQKNQVEKAEVSQGIDMKFASKKIKCDQEREARQFRDGLKQEMKLLKQEVEMLPKDQRKEALRRRREEKELEIADKEREFLEQQSESLERSMKRLSDQHREKIALLEKQFLQQKQQLLRSRESAIWEMEERHLHEKNQLAKRQLKDLFFLKRHQMLTRHEKELEQIQRINLRKEEELLQHQTVEKKRLPRIQKSEMKTRAQMFKQSLRISTIGSPDEEREKIKHFEESEKKRVKAEQLRQELKHKRQWEELSSRNITQLQELRQLQSEKRKMLMEQETQKINELEELYHSELRQWKENLVPRKQCLEEEFSRQLAEQEKFYGSALSSANGSANHTPDEIPRSSTARASVVL